MNLLFALALLAFPMVIFTGFGIVLLTAGKDFWKHSMICLIIGVLCIAAFWYSNANSTTEDRLETLECDVFSADAPFGRYWVETDAHGSGGLFYRSYNSDSYLRESYTIKYFNDGELDTAIVKSSDEHTHVIFTENVTEMSVKKVTMYRDWLFFGDNWQMETIYVDWYIYIPDPRLMNETVVK